MTPIADTTMQAVEYALRGLTLRADVRANNVANANTPNYRASRVDFESALRGALATGEAPAGASPAATPDGNPVDAQGNNVSLENDLIGLMKDNLLRDTLVNSYNFKAGVLRTAIQGR
jgi:flagellar basal-body rod protein FlgB